MNFCLVLQVGLSVVFQVASSESSIVGVRPCPDLNVFGRPLNGLGFAFRIDICLKTKYPGKPSFAFRPWFISGHSKWAPGSETTRA